MALKGPAVVTGAAGFVGRRLCALIGQAARLRLGDEAWKQAVDSARFADAVVFHLAARVHGQPGATAAAYRHDNADKSEALARAASGGGARHLVFLSSVKVLGEESSTPLATDASYAPEDDYGRSKQEAEERLLAVGAATGLPVTIVRSPLVYGAGARGNLATLRRWCDTPWPLPLGALHNRRSWIHVDDLAQLLLACASRAGGGTTIFHATHPESLSTTRVVAGLRAALRRPPRLFPMPAAVLEAVAGGARRGAAVRRLTRSLELDGRGTMEALHWRPVRTIDEALRDLARGEASA